ncbi:hypothetical protein LTR37_019360 [Vermiconidia calcicola]|uniref:Uncharacterized protein n=1 Tax=Vermiconidia calcicola TaxID=1690605 RepID=A0ACC3MEB4_9PEZI|nr:hypothetical protein LTR37_019360 [Vermiconidia calcicola]
MSRRSEEFRSLLTPTEEPGQPLPKNTTGFNFLIQYGRDSVNVTTWLGLAALVQSVLLLTFGRLALIPPAVLLGIRITDTFMMVYGLKRNRYMDGVIQRKTATAFPDGVGNYGNKPADSEVCVFLLGTRCNHPLGALAPGMSDIRAFFPKMTADLEEHREEYGFLTTINWLNADQRQAASEIMNVCYFKNADGLHEFAHSSAHREVWNWWNKHTKHMPHISIWHETYQVPKGSCKTIYINSHISGLNGASRPYTDEMTGKVLYNYPIVDASKGLLKTSAGRMSRSNASEHDAYGDDPYQNQ